MVIDFKMKRSTPASVIMGGTQAEVVSSYRYLGVHMDETLVYMKGKSRLHFLRRLKSNNCRLLLCTFYQSVVASAIFFGVMCWGRRHTLGTETDSTN